MYVPQDSMWREILKFFWFLSELNKVLVERHQNTTKSEGMHTQEEGVRRKQGLISS